MGYESRLYVVNKTTQTHEINGKEMVWGEIIAVFNLSKVRAASDRMREYNATDVFIYADDGDTEIVEDEYGYPLKEIPIPDVIKILEEAAVIEKYYNYKRYNSCIQLLKGFDLKEWENLVVLHYGY